MTQAFALLAFISLFVSLTSADADIANAVSARRMRSKRYFKRQLDAAIQNETDLDSADEDEYTDYVESRRVPRSGRNKLDEYLEKGCNFTRRYRAYEHNKLRITELNDNAVRVETIHGKVFRESYAINDFTDCDDECRAEYTSLGDIDIDSVAGRRRMEWELGESACITLDQDFFGDADAANTHSDMREECGAVKSQGSRGTCWAFASTAQLQCNYNREMGEARVFSEAYATDCSGADELSNGWGNNGGWSLDPWYTVYGACSDFYKEYESKQEADIDGDCECEVDKVYGQCYTFSPTNDASGKLAIANAAQSHSLWFGISLCSSFYDSDDTWFGCAPDEEIVGGHAMAIVGQHFGDNVLVRNSWGSGWGLDGDFGGHIWLHSDAWSNWNYYYSSSFPAPSPLSAETDFSYIGCYADKSARALPVYRGNGYVADSCLAACSDYPYFGLQYNGQCFCGDSYADAVQYGESSQCPTSMLGGTWCNNLYRNLAVTIHEYELLFAIMMSDIPDGWRWMTVEEAATRTDELVSGLGDWAIVKLDGGKIDGSGYGGKVTYWSDGRQDLGWVFVVPMYEGAEQSPMFVKEQPYEFMHPPQKSMPNTPPQKNTPHSTWTIDVSSFPSANVWAVSLFVLCLVLAVCVVKQKCNSAKGVTYAKVEITDVEMATDEDEALNA